MKWLWNWSKPKISSIVDNSQLEALRNDLTTLQNNVSSIQSSLSSYLTNNQSYSLTNQSDKFIINVASSANYVELQRGGNRKTTMGLGSSSSDNFSIESTGNILLKPNQYLDMNAKPIQNVANPTQNNQVATKQYVDNAINGVNTSNGTRLSRIMGTFYAKETPTQVSNLSSVYGSQIYSINVNNTSIPISSLNKYIISMEVHFISGITANLNGVWVNTGQGGYPNIANNNELGEINWVFLTNVTTPQLTKWTTKPVFEVMLILSDTLENITSSIQVNSINEVSNDNVLHVTSWENL